ncbi:MAG: flagellar basal-body MS-ring/collar protein FliF [Nitrospirota bacterium]
MSSGLMEVIGALPPQKKLLLIVLSLAVAGAALLIYVWTASPRYAVLFSGLGQEDVQLVIGKLKERKVEYKVTGNVVEVPEDKVDELRLELAGDGVPRGGGIGFEVFDKDSFGLTEFVQKINYRRALQGELARTIRQLSEVEDCRVHLVIPERTLFSGPQEHSRASIVLKLRTGSRPSEEQTAAIVHLVAGSVDGLTPEDVAVVDTDGRLLFKPKGDDPAGMLSDSQLEYRRALEKDLESRVQSMLETVLGGGKAIVRVNADLDFTQQELSEEKYDPASIIRSQQKLSEKESSGKVEASGVPGAVSNTPAKETAATSPKPGGSISERQSETSNYEVNMTKTKTVKPTGAIKSISAAVFVDGSYTVKDKKKTYVPRSQEEMTKLEAMIKGALGFNQQRGDTVQVANVPFDSPAEDEGLDEGRAPDAWYVRYALPYLKYAVALVGMALIFLLVVRPTVRSIASSADAIAKAREQAAAAVPELEPVPRHKMLAEGRGGVKQAVQENPAVAVSVVKSWLKER